MSASDVLVDFETKSDVDLKKAGAFRYAEDPSTDVICLGYSLDGGEPRVWTPGLPVPDDLDWAIRGNANVHAHNVTFERLVWRHVLTPRYGFPEPFEGQWRCTMAACGYRGLPMRLEKAAEALGLGERKDMDGHRKMQSAARGKDDFDTLEATYDYCAQDVRTEQAVLDVVGELPAPELRVFQLDARINDRGVRLDRELCEAAVAVGQEQERRLTARLHDLTDGAVETVYQRDRMLRWLREACGLDIDDLQADTVTRWLGRTDLTQKAWQALEIRQNLSKGTWKKYRTALECVGADGRVRGLLQYHGATTGRWAGRLVQPQNFRRPRFWEDTDMLADVVKTRDVDFVEMEFGDVSEVLADACRGMFVADEGRVFCAADFSSVESIVTAALAGEQWKLDVFARGECAYSASASGVVGFRVDKRIAKDPEHPDHVRHRDARQNIGKVMELAFGFGGGVGAWRGFDDGDEFTDEQVDEFKETWREQHPRIRDLWHGLENAAVSAVSTGRETGYRDVVYGVEDEWLWCRLPSGRRLWYRDAKIEYRPVPWDEDDLRPQVSYRAWRYGQWRWVRAYGGLFTENVVQATARDLMVPAMFRAEEEAGYPVVLTVHDELLTEPEAAGANVKVLEELMEDLPSWAAGWPVTAEGWLAWRYRK